MKFQTLALLGLFALTTTVTAQSASAQVANPTHLRAADVAAIASSRPTEGRPAARSASQIINLTHLTSDNVSTLRVERVSQTVQPSAFSLTPVQMSSDDTAAIGIISGNSQGSTANLSAAQPEYPPSPIVDVVVHRHVN